MKEYNHRWQKANPDKVSIRSKKWRTAHPEKYKANIDKWVQLNQERHKETRKKYNKKYYEEHKKTMNLHSAEYYSKNRLLLIEHQKKWTQTNPEKVRETSKRKAARRYRNLEFSPLNSYFEGSSGHHIDTKYIIYIPKKLHIAHPHRLKNPETMKRINLKSWDYMEASVL